MQVIHRFLSQHRAHCIQGYSIFTFRRKNSSTRSILTIRRCRFPTCGTRLSQCAYPKKGNSTFPVLVATTGPDTPYFRDILGRHKRLLAEVFYFAKHPNTPPDSESGTEQPVAETDDLREFLNANDLERFVRSPVCGVCVLSVVAMSFRRAPYLNLKQLL